MVLLMWIFTDSTGFISHFLAAFKSSVTAGDFDLYKMNIKSINGVSIGTRDIYF